MKQMENGDFRRIYSGKVNQTEDGLPCMKWSQVDPDGKLYSQNEGSFDKCPPTPPLVDENPMLKSLPRSPPG